MPRRPPYPWRSLRRPLLVFRLLGAPIGLLALAACSQIAVIPTQEREITLPPETAAKFEVRDLPETAPSPVPAAQAVAVTPAKGKGRKHKALKPVEAKPDQTVPPALVFPVRRPPHSPVRLGEKLIYDVFWLAAHAGELTLEALPTKQLGERKVYHFRGEGRSLGLFKVFYNVHYMVESFVDFQGWFSHKFLLHGSESKGSHEVVELHDYAAGKQHFYYKDVKASNGEVQEKNDVNELVPWSQDSLSALYYARTLPLADGSVIRVPLARKGEPWELALTVLGREEIGTAIGRRRAIKLKVDNYLHGELKQAGDTFVWLADDERKIILRFEGKLKLGTATAAIRKIEDGSPAPVDDSF